MNVAFDPWIPVITATGDRELASLCAVLTEGEKYADLAVRPHERVSLMRLFLCVAHAALDGPKDYDGWKQVPHTLPEAARNYLTEWEDWFELFHSTRPWLQIPELYGKKTSPVALLDFELATGNNSTLHDHAGQLATRQISPEKIGLSLLAFQNFSPGGGAPVAQWKTIKTSQVGNPDAPCLSQSMAHCLIRGKSLMATIHLNLPSFEAVRRIYKSFSTYKTNKKRAEWSRVEFKDIEFGRPVWEMFPDHPNNDDNAVVNATKTYLGRLVPVSRWVRLLNLSEMFCCNGFKYDTFKDGFSAEATAAVRVVTKKNPKGVETKERSVVRIDPQKALWRELSALLINRTSFGLGGPLAMENLPYDTEFDFQVCAMTRDQASMDIAVESVFHITPTFQNNLLSYQTEIVTAEKIFTRLGISIEEYRKEIDGSWEKKVEKAKNKWELRGKLYSIATNHFWTTIEKNLFLLMTHIEAIDTEQAIPTREAWRDMLLTTARDAYRIACSQETPRQIRAFAKGWQKLTARKGGAVATETKKEVA